MIFIVVVFANIGALRAQSSMSNNGIEVNIFDDLDLADSGEQDEFDSLSDSMTKSGMPLEVPKPVSDFQYWVRRLGSPLLLKYLAFKTYIKNLLIRKTSHNA